MAVPVNTSVIDTQLLYPAVLQSSSPQEPSAHELASVLASQVLLPEDAASMEGEGEQTGPGVPPGRGTAEPPAPVPPVLGSSNPGELRQHDGIPAGEETVGSKKAAQEDVPAAPCQPPSAEEELAQEEGSAAVAGEGVGIEGVILVTCRSAMGGRFPLNGTYFQVNEVFADQFTADAPIQVCAGSCFAWTLS